MYLEKLIAEPIVQLQDLCRFLGVEAPEAYLRHCATIVTKNPNRTRDSLDWSHRHVEMVKKGKRSCHWLANYKVGTS